MSDSNTNKSETADQVTDETLVSSDQSVKELDEAAAASASEAEAEADADAAEASDSAEKDNDMDGSAPDHDDQEDDDEEPVEDPYRKDKENILAENPDNLKTVGELLKYHRLRMGMSIPEMATAILARPRTVSDIETNALNERVYIDFISPFLERYCRVAGVDPDYVMQLYLSSISENVAIDKEPAASAPDKTMNRNWLLIVLIIIVAAGGYFIFSGDKTDSSGATNAPSGDPVRIELNADGSEASPPPVVIEDPANADAVDLKVVDENTARAAAQAHALAREQGPGGIAEISEGKAPESLTLPGDDYTVTGYVPAIAIKPGADKASEETQNGTLNPPVKETGKDAKDQGARGQDSKAGAKTDDKAEKPGKDAKAEAAKAEPKVELKGSPTDISGKVKVVNRKDLASLNSAEIAIVRKVALKLTDKQNKVLASGVYEPGKKIKVTGIPPLKIQLSDTRAVKIYYDGGEVDMPEAKQVILKLPMP